jgi:hypothetical protein
MSTNNTTTTVVPKNTKYQQDGDEAKEIAVHLPYFPFKGIPRFYDIGGFLYQPDVFQRIVDIFADRYREIGVDVIAGYVLVLLCLWQFAYSTYDSNAANIMHSFPSVLLRFSRLSRCNLQLCPNLIALDSTLVVSFSVHRLLWR